MDINQIIDLLLQHQMASNDRIYLIPSENTMSISARLPFLTDVIHRYSFPTEEENNWAWPGSAFLATIEREAQASLSRLFDVDYVNMKPISGLNCMTIMLSVLSELHGTLYTIDVDGGGHGSAGFIARKFGLTPQFMRVDPKELTIDLDQVEAQVQQQPGLKFVYLDQYMCLFPHDIRALRRIFGDDAVIHYDGSHMLGLIAGGQFQDPLHEGADCLAGSTHKSFPGPHKGIIMTNSHILQASIEKNSSFFVSHHHPADVVSLAVVAAEMEQWGHAYASQVVRNAQALGSALDRRGICVCAAHKGYTQSHQLWVDVSQIIDPYEASRLLLEANIVVNALEIPYLPSKIGLRLGVQETTHWGMTEANMDELAIILETVLVKRVSTSIVARQTRELKQRVARPSHILDLTHLFKLLPSIFGH